MRRRAVYIEDQDGLSRLYSLLDEGYVLDPEIYDGRPLRLENAAIYHLILYECDDEKPIVEEVEKPKVVSIKSIYINQADEWLKQGYELKDTFAKSVTLIKYAEEDE